MVGFIYKYENRLNHKVYIGQTIDLIGRKSGHKYRATFEKTKFYNAVRKYGWDNFDYDVIAQIEDDNEEKFWDKLDDAEVKYIAEFDSFNNGYNSTPGGHSCHGKELPESFREYCRNRTYSEETRLKMSLAAKARYQRMGKEAWGKMTHSHPRRFYTYSYSEKREAAKIKALGRPVLQLDSKGNTVNEFPSVKAAARYVVENLAPYRTVDGTENGIRRHCKGITNVSNYYGFVWQYKTNV